MRGRRKEPLEKRVDRKQNQRTWITIEQMTCCSMNGHNCHKYALQEDIRTWYSETLESKFVGIRELENNVSALGTLPLSKDKYKQICIDLMPDIRENGLVYLMILNTVSDFCSNHGFDLLAILKYNIQRIFFFKDTSQIGTLR